MSSHPEFSTEVTSDVRRRTTFNNSLLSQHYQRHHGSDASADPASNLLIYLC